MTGLIYVAIVALWAAVLIPMWLRRHDDDQARRIERHRVAMGTLARISEDPAAAQDAASRRRRIVVAIAATVGAIGTGAWIAGVVPGLVCIALWLPLAAFLPAVAVAERRARRGAAESALQARRATPIANRGGSADAMAMPLATSEASAAYVTSESTAARYRPRPSAVAWDEVFDQTA